MSAIQWTDSDSRRAEQLWSDYERANDVSGESGRTVGIDPKSGQIWFGESIQDVIAQRDAGGISVPLYFVRVGSPAYYRKGGRQ